MKSLGPEIQICLGELEFIHDPSFTYRENTINTGSAMSSLK